MPYAPDVQYSPLVSFGWYGRLGRSFWDQTTPRPNAPPDLFNVLGRDIIVYAEGVTARGFDTRHGMTPFDLHRDELGDS